MEQIIEIKKQSEAILSLSGTFIFIGVMAAILRNRRT